MSRDPINRKTSLLEKTKATARHQKYKFHNCTSATMNQNPLDILDTKLKQHGHNFWGWVVYRCTYSSDSEWAQFKEKLETDSRESLEFYAATDAMLKQHVWTFVDDQERLKDATKADVRRVFNERVNSF
jgi:hypothetical protein